MRKEFTPVFGTGVIFYTSGAEVGLLATVANPTHSQDQADATLASSTVEATARPMQCVYCRRTYLIENL